MAPSPHRPQTNADADPAFEAAWRSHRAFAVDLAFRMLGDIGEAEDIVQDAFARLLDIDVSAIDDIRAWLVVVVTRRCLDVLRSPRVRRRADEVPRDRDSAPKPLPPLRDPADTVTLGESVHLAMLVVLEQLSPAERTTFVLHDVFQYPFDTVAGIVGRSPASCRQLASRARRRIQAEIPPHRFQVQPADHQRVVEGFIAACAGGDVNALARLLDPNVAGGIDIDQRGEPRIQRGRATIARTLMRFLQPGLGVTLVSNPLPDTAGLLAFQHRQLAVAFDLRIESGLITHIEAVRNPVVLNRLADRLGLQH